MDCEIRQWVWAQTRPQARALSIQVQSEARAELWGARAFGSGCKCSPRLPQTQTSHTHQSSRWFSCFTIFLCLCRHMPHEVCLAWCGGPGGPSTLWLSRKRSLLPLCKSLLGPGKPWHSPDTGNRTLLRSPTRAQPGPSARRTSQALWRGGALKSVHSQLGGR